MAATGPSEEKKPNHEGTNKRPPGHYRKSMHTNTPRTTSQRTAIFPRKPEVTDMAPKRNGKAVSKDSEMALNRPEVLQVLRDIIDEGFNKVNNRYTVNTQKIAWSRVLVQACAAATLLMRDVDLDSLKARLEALEAIAQKRVQP